MKRIINLTQNNATPEQLQQGVFEPSNEHKEIIKKLLTFSTIPTKREIVDRAYDIAKLVNNNYQVDSAMIGGEPYLMSELESQLTEIDVQPVYAFTERVAVWTHDGFGSENSHWETKHHGFVEV